MAPRLRTVAPGERATRRRAVKTVSDAASRGTPRELLVALRARIATTIDNPNTPARDLAALSRRMQEIVRDIEALDAREREEGSDGGSVPDEPFDAASV